MTAASKAAEHADQVIAEARAGLSKLTRPVVVADIASGAARQATSAATDAGELHAAHLLIAELAVRLAERDSR